MLPVMSREQIRALDQALMVQLGIPSIVLMENAGRGATDRLVEGCRGHGPGALAFVVVVCGPGNNGGDGFVVARQLRARGVPVSVFLLGSGEALQGDARVNYRAYCGLTGKVTELGVTSQAASGLESLESALSTADCVVDALWGTGLTRAIEGFPASVVAAMNQAVGFRCALDMPSGLDANTGVPLGVAFRAHMTITFACPKLGLMVSGAQEYVGQLVVTDLGVPADAVPDLGSSAYCVESEDVRRALRRRRLHAHKTQVGHVGILAGSPGKIGTTALVSRGAFRAGAGLVTLCAYPEVAQILDTRVVEAMTAVIEPGRYDDNLGPLLEHYDSVVLGPGIGLDSRAKMLVEYVVTRCTGVLVMDADALTLLQDLPNLVRERAAPTVLTPHSGEMARLLGQQSREVEADRFGAVSEAVERFGATVVLKGSRTLIGAPNALPRVNCTGSPALATAGSGDVLAGIVGALACQMSPLEAAYAGAFLHGRAGEAWAQATGSDRGLLASDIAECLPSVIGELKSSNAAEGRCPMGRCRNKYGVALSQWHTVGVTNSRDS